MATPIYHITHLDNLMGIVSADRIWSDNRRIEKGFPCTNIGHANIKERRLRRAVPVSSGGKLGQYVPFNFCNRSVMLYVIHKNGVQGYGGGQQPVLHLVSSIQSVVDSGRPWAFTDRHAELAYAEYFDDLKNLDQVHWDVMPLKWWSDDDQTMQARQAEFLVYDYLPWKSVESIGVHNQQIKLQVSGLLKNAPHKPEVVVQPTWYY